MGSAIHQARIEQCRKKVKELLHKNPKKAYSVGQIASEIKFSYPRVQSALHYLVDIDESVSWNPLSIIVRKSHRIDAYQAKGKKK